MCVCVPACACMFVHNLCTLARLHTGIIGYEINSTSVTCDSRQCMDSEFMTALLLLI